MGNIIKDENLASNYCGVLCKSYYSALKFRNMSGVASFTQEDLHSIGFDGYHAEFDYDSLPTERDIKISGEMRIFADYVSITINNNFVEDYRLITHGDVKYIVNTYSEFDPSKEEENAPVNIGVRITKCTSQKSNLIDILIENLLTDVKWSEISSGREETKSKTKKRKKPLTTK